MMHGVGRRCKNPIAISRATTALKMIITKIKIKIGKRNKPYMREDKHVYVSELLAGPWQVPKRLAECSIYIHIPRGSGFICKGLVVY